MAFTFTDANVNELIASGQPVVIDCWATWCGPCVGMSPLIDDLAHEYEGRVLIGKYNIDDESELGAQYRIMSIPAFLFFKNGEHYKDLRLVGSQTREKMVENIEALLKK